MMVNGNELLFQLHIRCMRIKFNPHIPPLPTHREDTIKMNIEYLNYPNAYIKVAELMLPRPRPRFLKGDGEKLPLITVEVEI